MNNETLVAALAPIVSRVVTSHCWVKRDGKMSHTNRPLTDAKLAHHVNGGPAYGAAQIQPGASTTLIACLDLDSHGGETSWAEMQAAALRVMSACEGFGFRPIPFRSSGGRGMHIYFLWDSPQDAYSVRYGLRAVLESCGLRAGVGGVSRGEIEIFPKQNSVPVDGFGNMFVLPLAGASVPLDTFELDDMPKEWTAEMDWPVSLPVAVVEREIPQTRAALDPDTLPVELEQLRSALDMIPNSGEQELDYDEWRNIMFALHHATAGSDDGLALAHEFSARSSKYTPDFLNERVWPHIKQSHDGERGAITARTILKMARDHGWQEPIDADFEVIVAESAAVGGKKKDSRKEYRARTEFGNAERMLDRYGAGLMYVPELEAWFKWTGVYWQRAVHVELENMAKETIRNLPDEVAELQTAEERLEFFKFCAACQKASMVGNMIRLAASDPRVMVPLAQLDRHTYLLGVGNGAVDLRTGELLLPNKDHRITVTTTVEYQPGAPAALFEQTVDDVFFDEHDQTEFFQRLVGYALLARPKEDVLVIPYGSGSNGKSTVLGAIRDALGQHAKSASSETFLSSGQHGGAAGGPREDILRLRGARFVYISEPDEGSELREGLIKSMTGGDPMPARGVHGKTTVEVTPTWVAFMPTNHRPIVKGDDHAIWRRLMPVPFTRNFDKDDNVKKDTSRAERLAAEASGILTWCVRGAIAYQHNGLKPTAAVSAARDSYRSDMDLLADWLDERCTTGSDKVASNEELWNSWKAYAESRGELRLIPNSRALARRLTSRSFLPVRNVTGVRGRGFAGISVQADSDFESSDLM
ncbi:phage/plasmid primase, P4 family [Paraburkholderia sp. BL21I4N1]|uniref:phage/plasmid primase, P4 family n=1 Tax=Paraburkholderia sp. BL21I4N1 TaxID=1938801 RepID=UPI000CFB7010|nr:phage/plasmid primase, P4 family [Paraburkholderia sp. BL21I4N1]PQV51850.1 putative DNA primase/helicase [Paraburkholderia sp. BL21I4N1]